MFGLHEVVVWSCPYWLNMSDAVCLENNTAKTEKRYKRLTLDVPQSGQVVGIGRLVRSFVAKFYSKIHSKMLLKVILKLFEIFIVS